MSLDRIVTNSEHARIQRRKDDKWQSDLEKGVLLWIDRMETEEKYLPEQMHFKFYNTRTSEMGNENKDRKAMLGDLHKFYAKWGWHRKKGYEKGFLDWLGWQVRKNVKVKIREAIEKYRGPKICLTEAAHIWMDYMNANRVYVSEHKFFRLYDVKQKKLKQHKEGMGQLYKHYQGWITLKQKPNYKKTFISRIRESIDEETRKQLGETIRKYQIDRQRTYTIELEKSVQNWMNVMQQEHKHISEATYFNYYDTSKNKIRKKREGTVEQARFYRDWQYLRRTHKTRIEFMDWIKNNVSKRMREKLEDTITRYSPRFDSSREKAMNAYAA